MQYHTLISNVCITVFSSKLWHVCPKHVYIYVYTLICVDLLCVGDSVCDCLCMSYFTTAVSNSHVYLIGLGMCARLFVLPASVLVYVFDHIGLSWCVCILILCNVTACSLVYFNSHTALCAFYLCVICVYVCLLTYTCFFCAIVCRRVGGYERICFLEYLRYLSVVVFSNLICEYCFMFTCNFDVVALIILLCWPLLMIM